MPVVGRRRADLERGSLANNGRLANYRDVPENGINRLAVVRERRVVRPGGLSVDDADGIKDILNAEAPISRRHERPRGEFLRGVLFRHTKNDMRSSPVHFLDRILVAVQDDWFLDLERGG